MQKDKTIQDKKRTERKCNKRTCTITQKQQYQKRRHNKRQETERNDTKQHGQKRQATNITWTKHNKDNKTHTEGKGRDEGQISGNKRTLKNTKKKRNEQTRTHENERKGTNRTDTKTIKTNTLNVKTQLKYTQAGRLQTTRKLRVIQNKWKDKKHGQGNDTNIAKKRQAQTRHEHTTKLQ